MKKGPKIDLSKLRSGSLKPPPGLTGIYRELKSQHLLLIVVLLVVALVAVPIVISSKGGGDESDAAAVPAIASGSSAKKTSLKVSRWTPGLLDYKKSLHGGHPINPFETAGTEGDITSETNSGGEETGPPAEAEVEVESPGSGGDELPPEALPSPVETSPGPEPRPTGGEEGGKKQDRGDEEDVTADFQVTEVHQDGGVDKSPIRRDVQKLTKLPNESSPALTYVGPSQDGTKALMQVSPEVTAMIGDSNCVVHGDPCGVLALEVARPETIVFGPRGLTYRIELVRIGDHGTTAARSKSDPQRPKSGGGLGNSSGPRSLEVATGIGGNRVAQPRLLSDR